MEEMMLTNKTSDGAEGSETCLMEDGTVLAGAGIQNLRRLIARLPLGADNRRAGWDRSVRVGGVWRRCGIGFVSFRVGGYADSVV